MIKYYIKVQSKGENKSCFRYQFESVYEAAKYGYYFFQRYAHFYSEYKRELTLIITQTLGIVLVFVSPVARNQWVTVSLAAGEITLASYKMVFFFCNLRPDSGQYCLKCFKVHSQHIFLVSGRVLHSQLASTNFNIPISFLLLIHSTVRPLFHQCSPDLSSV